MSDEQRLIGLTDEEVDAITLTIDTEEPTLNVAPLLKAVARVIAAREIAAEQAGREDNALHEMCYVSGSKALEAREAAARREALLEAERLGKVVQDAATDLLNISAYLIRASYREDAKGLEEALRSGSARGKALRDRLRAALADDVTQRPDVAHEEDGR